MNANLTNSIENFLANPSEANEKSLIKELKSAEFLAPVVIDEALAKPDGGVVYEEEGSNIKFILLKDEESGLSYFPAFSSKDEMMKWRKDAEQESVNLRLKDYLAAASSSQEKYDGVVIDAFSYSLILDFEKIRAVCEG